MRRPRGFSLIETMVAMVIASLLVLGLVTIVQANARAGRTATATANIQNADQALGSLVGPLVTTAGFLGCATTAAADTILNPPNGVTADYTNAITGMSGNPGGGTLAVRPSAANAGNTGAWSPALPNAWSGQVFPGSDALVLIGEVPGTFPARITQIDLGADSLTLQAAPSWPVGQIAAVSDCAKATVFEVTGLDGTTVYHDAAGTPGNAVSAFDPQYPAGAQIAPLQETALFLAHGYDGQPMLMESLLNGTTWTVSPLLPDVDALRFLYGLGGAGAVTGYVPADQVANWADVTSVRMAALLAGPSGSGPPGTAPTTSWNLLGETVTVPNDGRLRHVVTFTFDLHNRSL